MEATTNNTEATTTHTVACTECGAQVGETCTRASGRARSASHMARRWAWSDSVDDRDDA